jgi:hypothetical protein
MRRDFARSIALLVLAPLASGGAGGVLAACSSGESNAPLGMGDTVHVDVEASTLPPQQGSSDADLDPDGIFDRLDGSIFGSGNYDAASHAVLKVCLLPKDAGGPEEGGKSGKDAAATAPAVESDGGIYDPDAGCVAFPSTCDPGAKPDPCFCLLAAFTPAEVPCTYPSCAVDTDKSGFTLYCPAGSTYGGGADP